MKKITVFVLSTLILLIFAACADNTSISKNSGADSANSNINIDSKIDENSQNSDSHNNSETKKIETVLSSGVTVNANIHISPAVDLNDLRVLKSKIKIQDYKKAKDIFLNDKEIVEEIVDKNNPTSMTNSPYMVCSTKDDYLLVTSGEDLNFSDFFYYNDLTSFFYDSYLAVENNAYKYNNGKNLNFASIDEAMKKIDIVVKDLNINVYEKPTVFTFDKSSDASDEYYLFKYQVRCDDLPLSTNTSGSMSKGNFMQGTKLEVLYAKNGIEGFYLPYAFEKVSTTSENQKGLSAEESLELVNTKYNSIILEGDYEVEQIDFEYLPVKSEAENYTLTPAWRFYMKHVIQFDAKDDSDDIVDFEEKSFLIFNAITGEEIINDYGSI